MTNAKLTAGNIHLPYDEPIRMCHRVTARLADRYLPEGGKVLDAGCGVGHTLEVLGNLAPSAILHAADIDPVCLDRTAERVPGVEKHVIRSMSDLPSLGADFDVCILSHVLEHTKEPISALNEALGVIGDGGHLILALPNPVCLYVIWKNIRRLPTANRGHVCCWDRSHMINLLENIMGLTVVEYKQDTMPVFPLWLSRRVRLLRAIERGLSFVFPWLSFSNIAVIRKAVSKA